MYADWFRVVERPMSRTEWVELPKHLESTFLVSNSVSILWHWAQGFQLSRREW